MIRLVTAGLSGLVAARPARCANPLADASLCAQAIAAAEPSAQLPAGLLSAIALTESGARPWTIDVAGSGRVFDSKDAAIAAVRDAQDRGIASIDVGCMQINLFYHPQAFADLDAAFDPATNVAYAIRFLGALHAQSGEWGAAIAAYHSATPELGAAYAQRVVAHWPDAPPLRLPAALPGAAATPAALAAEIDPNHTLTADFRARLVAAAGFRHRQQLHALGTAALPPAWTAEPPAGTRDAQIDPRHTLTAEFRAQLVAAAAARLRRERGAAAASAATIPKAKAIASPQKPLLAAQLSPSAALP